MYYLLFKNRRNDNRIPAMRTSFLEAFSTSNTIVVESLVERLEVPTISRTAQ